MDKKVFAAVALCAGIFLLWQNFYLKPLTERQQAWSQQHAQQAPVETAKPSELSISPSPSKMETGTVAAKAARSSGQKSVVLGDSAYSYTILTKGGVVSDVGMVGYRGQKTDKVRKLIGGSDELELNTPAADLGYISAVDYTIERQDKNGLVLAYDDANVSIKRTYSLNAAVFSLDNENTIVFKKQAPSHVYVGLKSAKTLTKDEAENERRQIYLNRIGGQKTWTVSDVDEVKEESGQGVWVGFASRYFLNAIANTSGAPAQFQARPVSDHEVTAGFFYPAAKTSNIAVRMYYGPKDIDILKAAGTHLETAVDFGWFTIFAYPMLTALKWFYKYVHNFGIAIILLTVLVKLLTYPLTLKSMKSMKQMQRIQPQLQRLRERYKDDKEKLNREMLQLMKSNGYNPASGCLPIFIQMPIFVALYNVLNGAIDLYGQPFFGWIHDLSLKDPLYVTPVLLALMMFIQQKMTPNTASDPAQQRMMMMMPLIFGFMMLSLPSGLTLYMLVNSVVSVLQQVAINKTINVGASAAA
ncbi:MAG: membrane protein insertase YidC [Deltaproteobacteria bacterium]|nr:membrane protein insertase YidC [Deltaproteobacteria bacterium]